MSILFPTGIVLEFLAGLKVSTDSSGVETEAAEEKFARSVSKRYPRNKRIKFMSLPYVALSLLQNNSMYIPLRANFISQKGTPAVR
jgi:hypothetical protein|tara:strand:+ start:175 stop:432 length:258 start_codon:yes stop_codon:yes gene_type:complete